MKLAGIKGKKWGCLVKAMKSESAILWGMIAFCLVSIAMGYASFRFKENVLLIFMLAFGLATLLCGYIFISSVVYKYEINLVQKLGKNIRGSLASKIEDEGRLEDACEDLYILEFCYSFEGQNYNGSHLIDSKPLFEALSVGDDIPIRVLSTKPKLSKIREIKLKRELNLVG